MKISRRNFIGAFSASLAAVIPFTGSIRGAGLGSVLGLGHSKIPGDALSQLSWSSFYPYINTDFEFASFQGHSPVSSSRLTLMGMTGNSGMVKATRARDPRTFVLTFKGPAQTSDPRLAQDTYSVEHFALGRFDLFISDGNVVNGEYIYTAVINRATA
jgi:hypothetical protein